MFRFLKEHAEPIEYSVFLAHEDMRRMQAILDEAVTLIDPSEDDLRCYPLPSRGLRARLGRAALPEGIVYSDLPAAWLGLPELAQKAFDPARAPL